MHPTVLRKKYFFYPFGNTTATSLVQDLAPEEDACILLLGCGDPRNILFTCYCDGGAPRRVLDFTCCDAEAAVLARNVLLFALVIDDTNKRNRDRIWNIFYHFYLDAESLSLLVEQCRRLVSASASIDTWRASPYGSFVKMCSIDTLERLRWYWARYVTIGTLTGAAKKKQETSYAAEINRVRRKDELILGTARSAGPLLVVALPETGGLYNHFWKFGVTDTADMIIKRAKLVNPTMLNREEFCVHYAAEPLVGFHLAGAFAPLAGAKKPAKITTEGLLEYARVQFGQWCNAFRDIATQGRCTVRLFAGDALSLCAALQAGSLGLLATTGVGTAPWDEKEVVLDGGGYNGPTAIGPWTFNVIETSNLADHLGLLNILLYTSPLLLRGASSVIYTETLVTMTEDPMKEFQERLCGDIPLLSLFLGVAPLPYLTRSDSHSNTHEHLMQTFLQRDRRQHHERVAWKIPDHGDPMAICGSDRRLGFEPKQLARALFDMYLAIFRDENVTETMRSFSIRRYEQSGILHYTRGSFAAFLRLVKHRTFATDWPVVMETLLGLIEDDRTLLVGLNYYQDLCTQLHILDVYTVSGLRASWNPNAAPYRGWGSDLPLTVCVTLVVPRKSLTALANMDAEEMATPLLQCDMTGTAWHNFFSSIHTCFGTPKVVGTGPDSQISVEYDSAGLEGQSPLVVSFWIPARILMFNDIDTARVSLHIRSTPHSVATFSKYLGNITLKIFERRVMDNTSVFITRERPNIKGVLKKMANVGEQLWKTAPRTKQPVFVTLDGNGQTITTLTKRIDIVDAQEQKVFGGGASVSTSQLSPCNMRVDFGRWQKHFSFPLPVDGTRNKVRIARKSLYIEVLVPPSTPLDATGFSLNPFPVVLTATGAPTPYTLHHLPLNLLPELSTSSQSKLKWMNPHVALSFSDRERALREATTASNGSAGDPIVDLKESLFTIFMSASGLQTSSAHQAFGLSDPDIGVNTLIFVRCLRLDPVGHTVVVDADVVPLTVELAQRNRAELLKINEGLHKIIVVGDEKRYWKQLLVAATERCRDWIHDPQKCTYKTKGAPVSYKDAESPLCNCAKGRPGPGFQWKGFASHATRAAISPVFAVGWLEAIGQAPLASIRTARKNKTENVPPADSGDCAKCGKSGKLLQCSRCRDIAYCSKECQKADWKVHKLDCRSA